MTDFAFPSPHIAIVDQTTGRPTRAFWRLLEVLWNRTGGSFDISDDNAASEANALALISALDGPLQDLEETSDALERRVFGAQDIDETRQRVDDLRAKLAELESIVSSLRDETGVEDRLEELVRRVSTVADEPEDFSLALLDEGNSLATRVDSINFTGAGVAASVTGRAATVDITGGGTGGGGAVSSVFGRTGAIAAAASDYDANQIDYDNTSSGLSATDAQAAIDAVLARTLVNQPLLSTFSNAVTTAGSTANAADNADFGLSMSLRSTSAGNKFFGRYKAAPALPFTATARLRVSGEIGDASSRAGSFSIRNSANGNLENIGYNLLNTGVVNVIGQRRVDATFTATFVTVTQEDVALTRDLFFRIAVTAGGAITYSFSIDGVSFFQLASSSVATHIGTLNQIGFNLLAFSSGDEGALLAPYYVES